MARIHTRQLPDAGVGGEGLESPPSLVSESELGAIAVDATGPNIARMVTQHSQVA